MAISRHSPITLPFSLQFPSHKTRLVFLPLRTPPPWFFRTLKAGSTSTITPSRTVSSPVGGKDDIELLKERMRKEHRKRGDGSNTGPTMDRDEAERYMGMVKEQQQRGLQKLRGEEQKQLGGFGYQVDPYQLQPGDYVVHRKENSCAMDSLYDIQLISQTVPVILDNSDAWFQVLSEGKRLGKNGIIHVKGVSRDELKANKSYSNALLINRTANLLALKLMFLRFQASKYCLVEIAAAAKACIELLGRNNIRCCSTFMILLCGGKMGRTIKESISPAVVGSAEKELEMLNANSETLIRVFMKPDFDIRLLRLALAMQKLCLKNGKERFRAQMNDAFTMRSNLTLLKGHIRAEGARALIVLELPSSA